MEESEFGRACEKKVRPFLFVGNPKLKKYPVSNETLLAGSVNENFPENLKTLLCDKIMGLITQCCLQRPVPNYSIEDSINECYLRIWSYRHTYDYRKAKVSTWVTWVCRSVLYLMRKKIAKHNSTVVLAPDMEKEHENYREPMSNDPDTDVMVSLKSAIEEIKKKAKKDEFANNVVDKMFGGNNLFKTPAEIANEITCRFMKKKSDMNESEKISYVENLHRVNRVVRTVIAPIVRKHCNYDDACIGISQFSCA